MVPSELLVYLWKVIVGRVAKHAEHADVVFE
jgi:hypothetical protein